MTKDTQNLYEPKTFASVYLDKLKIDQTTAKAMQDLANDENWKIVCENFFYPVLRKLDSTYLLKEYLEQKTVNIESFNIEMNSNIKAFGILDSLICKINKKSTRKSNKISDIMDNEVDIFE